MSKYYKFLIIISIIGLLLIIVLSIFAGQQKISLIDVFKVFFSKDYDEINYLIIKKIRIPRIVASLLVGAALSISGAVLQGIFDNPLASPYLLGISNGAGFTASIAIILGLSGLYLQIFAFFGGIIAFLLAILFSYFFKSKGSISIIIGGILIGNFFAALTMYIKLIADPLAKLPSIVYWLMGSFVNVTEKSLIIPFFLILFSSIILIMLSWKLNILAFGDIHARSLGEKPFLLKLIVLITTTIATSAAISICGIIGWIGVVIPQLARFKTSNDFRKLLPISILWGASYTCFVDSLARMFFKYELPAGLVSSIIGIPFAAFILSRRKNDF
ncbi:MAG: iron ABC transporter permease [Spirochaetota bacterium]